MSAPENCPHCGAEVPARARVCPECGADETTGWNDQAATQRLGVSDPEDFDADEFAREEWGPPARRGLAWGWVLVAAILLAALLWWMIPR
ncbi:MAG: zinc ribbon domain-containing protein [Verrucomicrobiae bacterium]|nr:zinc ribbon domain-containing protein [Verrucomicrobiae bacterium]